MIAAIKDYIFGQNTNSHIEMWLKFEEKNIFN